MHPLLLESESNPRATTRTLDANWIHLVEANPGPAWGADAAGRLITANRRWSELLGLAPAAIDDSFSLRTLIHPDDIARLQQPVAKIDAIEHYEYRLLAADGTCHWMRDSVSPVLSADGEREGYLGFTENIQAQKDPDDQAEETQKAKALGSLASRVAHDFNNQITAIRMFADILRSNLSQPQNLELVDQIVHCCSSAEFLTKKLNSFSRHEIAQPERLDLTILVENLRGFVGSLIADYIDVEFALEPNPQWVEVDAKQFEQVFFNLCLNARDTLTESGKLMTIADTGAGISPADLGQVFDPFFSTKARNQGTGLGLAHCMKIARESRGDITIESKLGEGTRVHFWLPVAGAPKAKPTPKANSPAKILLVEDDELVRNISSMFIQSLGHELHTFNRAEPALTYADQHGIDDVDLLITDIAMPGMDGHELAQNFLGRRSDLLVLFISGFIDNPATKAALESGRHHFLPKPFSSQSLGQKIDRLIPHRNN